MKVPVSVLIPTYNRSHLLPETIDSILSQTSAPSEVIVVDDGGTDDTEGALKPFRNRVTYVRVENGGECRARNVAASFATCPYLAFCDSDDLWRKDKLEIQMDMHLKKHPDLSFSFTNFVLVSGGKWSSHTKFEDAPSSFFAWCQDVNATYFICNHPLYDLLLRFQPIFPSTIIITKSFFSRIGGYTEHLGRVLSVDLEFDLKCAQHAPIGVVNEPVVGIRKHEGNISGNAYTQTKGEIDILKYALENHDIGENTRSIIGEEIRIRSIDAAYGAFRKQHFEEVLRLLQDVPSTMLDSKTKLKYRISKLPVTIAKLAHSLVVRD